MSRGGRRAGAGRPRNAVAASDHLHLRLTTEQRAAYEDAAERADAELGTCAKARLDAAACAREDQYDPMQRALEKKLSREADAQALASGEKTREQLRAENGAFAFPAGRVRVDVSRVKIKLRRSGRRRR